MRKPVVSRTFTRIEAHIISISNDKQVNHVTVDVSRYCDTERKVLNAVKKKYPMLNPVAVVDQKLIQFVVEMDEEDFLRLGRKVDRDMPKDKE